MTRKEIKFRIARKEYDFVHHNGEVAYIKLNDITHYDVGSFMVIIDGDTKTKYKITKECVTICTKKGVMDFKDMKPFDPLKYGELIECSTTNK